MQSVAASPRGSQRREKGIERGAIGWKWEVSASALLETVEGWKHFHFLTRQPYCQHFLWARVWPEEGATRVRFHVARPQLAQAPFGPFACFTDYLSERSMRYLRILL